MQKTDLFNDRGLLILGALNTKKDDSNLACKNPHLVQFIYKNEIYSIRQFSNWHDRSVSSMCWSAESPYLLYVNSMNELYEFNLKSGKLSNLNVSDLDDIHEIKYVNDVIWIANTGKDNIISYNPKQNKIIGP